MKAFLSVVEMDRNLIAGAKVAYDAEAIFARRDVMKSAYIGVPIPESEGQQMLLDEIALARGADVVISVSPAEKHVLEQYGTSLVQLLGFSCDIDPTHTPFDQRTDILFVGAIHSDDSPNADSLRWFASEVLPHVRRQLGSAVRFKVVGMNRAASIAALDGAAFNLVGPVEDLKPSFEEARLVVAPTRFAAGIPHKVYQAAAFGVPCVATDLIREQTGWVAGQDLLAASDPIAFANACVMLYRDEEIWKKIRKNALERCRTDCSPDRFSQTVAQIVDILCPAPARVVQEDLVQERAT